MELTHGDRCALMSVDREAMAMRNGAEGCKLGPTAIEALAKACLKQVVLLARSGCD